MLIYTMYAENWAAAGVYKILDIRESDEKTKFSDWRC